MKGLYRGVFPAILILSSFVGGAYAFRQVRSGTVNTVHLSSLNNSIVETYRSGGSILPGESTEKIVYVTNDGDTDSLVRIKVQVAFGEEREGEFTADDMLDTSVVEIPYHDTCWFYDQQEDYYYYKGILKPGETTKEPLFDSFTLSEDIPVKEYANKTGKILVSMESVQADGNGAELWGKTYEELGVEKPVQETGQITSVTYLGPEKKFDIETTKEDLFANFKDLVPGCGRSQIIHVANGSQASQEIFLYAEETSQDEEAEADLVEDLLKKYARITVQNAGEKLYEGNVWGNLQAETDSMKAPISLGTFSAGEVKNLAVTLKLDPLMDNRYQKVLGRVRWVFLVEENGADSGKTEEDFTGKEDPAGHIATPVQTGDTNAFLPCLACFVSGGIGICYLLWRKKRKEKDVDAISENCE